MVGRPPGCFHAAMSARAWMLFGVVSLLWGVPYLFIEIAVEEVSPTFLAFARVALAAAVLAPIAVRRGALRGLGARWKALTAFAVFEVVVPFPLIGFGQQYVSSSLAAILISSLPLIIALLALRVDPEERVSGLRLVGLGVGLAGVVLLLGLDVAGSRDELLGAGAILLATVGYAIGPMIVKRRFSDVDPVGSVTGAMLVAAILLAPPALAAAPSSVPSAGVLAALAVLGAACTALAFLLYFTLIATVGPSRASVITYVNPAVAVALGVALLGEDITGGMVAGLLLILAGSWLSTGGRQPPGLSRAQGRSGAAAAAPS
jgi:drug/metabolite transporter (DMT)-like permease